MSNVVTTCFKVFSVSNCLLTFFLRSGWKLHQETQYKIEEQDNGKGRGEDRRRRGRGERRSSANPCSVSVTWLITINFPGIDGLPGSELHSLLHFAWYVLCVPWHDSHSTTPSLVSGSPTRSTSILALRKINSWATVFWRRAINMRLKNTNVSTSTFWCQFKI